MSGLKFMGKDPVGLAKPIKVDNFGNLINSNGKKNVSGKRNGVLAATSGQLTVLEVDEPFILDRLMLTSNVGDSPYLRVYAKVDGVWISAEITYVPNALGTQMIGLITPNFPVSNPNDIFSLTSYETGKYGIKLNAPLNFCEGCKITVENYTASNINCALFATGRTL